LAIVLGGRWFPGVHQRAQIDIAENSGTLHWESSPGHALGFGIRVTASIPSADQGSLACEPVGGTCLGANIGLSPDHHGVLEAARMEPDHRIARHVIIDEIDSAFLSSFSTAQAAPSYVLTNVGVTWTPAASPMTTDHAVRA